MNPVLFCFGLLAFFHIALSAQAQPLVCKSEACIEKIKSIDQFKTLSSQLDPSGRRVVKFVYKRNPRTRQGQIFFFDTERWQYHFDFVTSPDGLDQNEDLQRFNINYAGSGDTREWNLGSLILDKDFASDKLLFEMWTGDTLHLEYLKELVAALSAQSKIKIVYHPLSVAQEKVLLSGDSQSIASVLTRDLYPGRTRWVLNPGEAIGRVIFVKTEADLKKCQDFKTIVVFEKVPNELGLVGGVITSEYQTPLSHVNVKSINRGTLNLSWSDVFSALQKSGVKEGDTIRIAATSGGEVNIENLSSNGTPEPEIAALVKNFWDARRPQGAHRLNPVADLLAENENRFIAFNDMFGPRLTRDSHRAAIRIVGAKSTNLGFLQKAFGTERARQRLNIHVPDGYGIPFNFFESYMNEKQEKLVTKMRSLGLDPGELGEERAKASPQQIIDLLLKKRGFYKLDNTGSVVEPSICEAQETLKDIRSIIHEAKSPETLDRMVKIFNDLYNPGGERAKIPRLRLRSSTNSEDLPGFSGAGLYDSDGVSLYKRLPDDSFDSSKPKKWDKVEEDLKEVISFLYAGVWNDRAWQEREWYGLHANGHFKVKVGLTVHRAFNGKDFDGEVGELANGVGISKNIYDMDRPGEMYLNGQHFDLAVTNPPLLEELKKYGVDPAAPYSTEELIVTTFNAMGEDWRNWPVQRRSDSSVLSGQSVLQSSAPFEAQNLALALVEMNATFARIYGVAPEDFALDTEWKIYGPRREIWFKQARPFYNGQDLAAGPSRSFARAKTRGRTNLGPRSP